MSPVKFLKTKDRIQELCVPQRDTATDTRTFYPGDHKIALSNYTV